MGSLSNRQVLLSCTHTGSSTYDNTGDSEGKNVVFWEGLEGLKEIRVRLEVEKTPSSTRDPRRVSVLCCEELDFNNPQRAFEVSVPPEEDGSQVVVGYRGQVVPKHYGNRIFLYETLAEIGFVLVAGCFGVNGANHLAKLFKSKATVHKECNVAPLWVRPRKGGKTVVIKGDLGGFINEVFKFSVVGYSPRGRNRSNPASD